METSELLDEENFIPLGGFRASLSERLNGIFKASFILSKVGVFVSVRGNTGTGKSTLLNILKEKTLFQIGEEDGIFPRVIHEDDSFRSNFSSREADLQETRAALQSLAKKLFEIKDKAEALQDMSEVKQCRTLIRFVWEELRYVEAEYYNIYLRAILRILLFIAEKCGRYLSRSVSVGVLLSQALEDILIAAGDVEENPGPTYLTDKELTEVCNQRLDEGDVSVILKAVSPISAECYSSFLCILGLPESQLSKIKAEHHGKPGEFLREGINCLLRENFNTDKFGLLTWRRLVEAVADTAGGNDHRLARKIIAKHKELPGGLVDRERESLKSAAAHSVDYSDPDCKRKFRKYGSFAAMFPKLKQSLEKSVKPDDLKDFLRYFSNPASPEHCLVDKQLYANIDSTSQILDSLHPTYINPANLLLLQEIVDNYGSDHSKKLFHDYAAG